jgi:hypothetical protein
MGFYNQSFHSQSSLEFIYRHCLIMILPPSRRLQPIHLVLRICSPHVLQAANRLQTNRRGTEGPSGQPRRTAQEFALTCRNGAAHGQSASERRERLRIWTLHGCRVVVVTPLLCLFMRQEGRMNIRRIRVTDVLQVQVPTENIP